MLFALVQQICNFNFNLFPEIQAPTASTATVAPAPVKILGSPLNRGHGYEDACARPPSRLVPALKLQKLHHSESTETIATIPSTDLQSPRNRVNYELLQWYKVRARESEAAERVPNDLRFLHRMLGSYLESEDIHKINATCVLNSQDVIVLTERPAEIDETGIESTCLSVGSGWSCWGFESIFCSNQPVDMHEVQVTRRANPENSATSEQSSAWEDSAPALIFHQPLPEMLRILTVLLTLATCGAECVEEECGTVASAASRSQSLLQVAKTQTGGYEIGGDNTQSCSYQRERLPTPAECMEAAAALGKNYGFTGSYAGWPKDCFMYRDVVYFNEDQVTCSGRDSARLICKRVETTTTTTTESLPNVVSYEIGAPGFDCAVGHVVSTHIECASSALLTAVGISFSNWLSTSDLQFGCLYSSSLHALFFNYYEGGSVDYNYMPVCKTESNPVIRNFNIGVFDSNSCAAGNPIQDVELCREAAAFFGEVFSTEGSYSGYPQGCFKFLNGDVYWNRHEGNHPSPNAAPICMG
eukprot:s1262_g10.t1